MYMYPLNHDSGEQIYGKATWRGISEKKLRKNIRELIQLHNTGVKEAKSQSLLQKVAHNWHSPVEEMDRAIFDKKKKKLVYCYLELLRNKMARIAIGEWKNRRKQVEKL